MKHSKLRKKNRKLRHALKHAICWFEIFYPGGGRKGSLIALLKDTYKATRCLIPLVLVLDAQAERLPSDSLEHLKGYPIYNVLAYGAKPDDNKVDTRAIQLAASACAANGGGIVYLPPGVYYTTNTLSIGSRTHLMGAGAGVTEIRELPLPYRIGVTNGGARVYGTIALVGASNSSVSGLTVNHVGTNKMNGIILVPKGLANDGTPCRNCVVRDCEVIGARGVKHEYLIWFFRAEDCLAENNVVDGRCVDRMELSEQEGMEIFGGRGNRFLNNTVRNVGNAAYNVASSPGQAMSHVADIWVNGNRAENCGYGIRLQCSYDPVLGPMNAYNLSFSDNRFSDIWHVGIQVFLFQNTTLENLRISGNCISNIVGPYSEGIQCYGYGAFKGMPPTIRNVSIDHNSIAGVTNTLTATAPLHLFWWSNTSLTDNYVRGGRYYGLAVDWNCENITVRGNTVEDSWGEGILVSNAKDATLLDNRVIRPNRRGAGQHAIVVTQAERPTLMNNQTQSGEIYVSDSCIDPNCINNSLK